MDALVVVLRLGHRFSRDARISTHLGLTARAFGAKSIVFDARCDDVRKSIEAVCDSWGGDFEVKFCESPKKYIRDFDGFKVHLTMYGMPLGESIPKAQKHEKILVIVGGAKVQSEVYELADMNVGVGSQPHSEVAALAVFLDRLSNGGDIEKEFPGRHRIIPQERGKKMELL